MKNSFNTLRHSAKFERLVNIALVAVALLFAGVLGKVILSRYNSPAATPPLASGTKLTWAEMDWGRAGRTLVLALSTDCRFCSESAPFYRHLVKGLSDKGGARVVAVLPQDVGQGRDYVNSLGFSVDEVRQMDLARLGLKGTPTIMLVDGAGVVTDVMTGKLAARQELELLDKLRLKEVAPGAGSDRDSVFLDTASVQQNLRRKDFVLVDVEDRDIYNVKHIENAVNIPGDELEVRALNELKPTDTIVIYCHYCEADIMSEMARDVLLRNGFERVYILREGLRAWELEEQRRQGAPN